jgi:hypothetical protein
LLLVVTIDECSLKVNRVDSILGVCLSGCGGTFWLKTSVFKGKCDQRSV